MNPSVDALRDEYEHVLPDKIRELASAIAEAKAHPQDASRTAEVARKSHMLGGTAGSYGFPEIGEMARRIEEAALRLPHDPEPDELLRQIEEALEEALRRAPQKAF